MARKVLRTIILKIIEELCDPNNRVEATIKRYGICPQSYYQALEQHNLVGQHEIMQQVRAEMLFEEIVDISDSDLDAMRARNRIDARKLYASKMKPHKFGDKLQIDVNTNVDLSNALLEAKTRRSAIDASYQKIDAPVITEPELNSVAVYQKIDKTEDAVNIDADEATKMLIIDMLK